MKFFNAMNRKIEHINAGIQTFEIDLESSEYLDIPYIDRYNYFKNIVSNNKHEGFAICYKVLLKERSEETILDDDEISNIFSNILVAYSETFPEQRELVSMPSKELYEKFPVTPGSLGAATVIRIVKKPIQIIIERVYENGEDYGEETIVFV